MESGLVLISDPPLGASAWPCCSAERDHRSTIQRSSSGRSSAVEGGMAQAVLLQAGDPVLEVLTRHYDRSFGKIHAVGRGDAAGAPSVKDLLYCLMCERWTTR